MAASIASSPDSPAYNQDDIYVTIETDLQTEAAGNVEIVLSATGPSIGEEFLLEWGGNSITFTVAAATNSQATAWPTKGGETLDEYAERVGEAFRENYLLTQHWDVSVTGSTVEITLKVSGAMDITVTENLTNVAVTVVDGIDNAEPNLSALVELWQKGATFTEDQRITTLQATYSSIGQININLRELLPVNPSLPNTAHIGLPIIFSSWLRGVASNAYCPYYLRVADKYGDPPIPEALVKSDTYIALEGSTSADMEPGIPLNFYVKILHNYRRADGGTFYKPIAEGQPDWLYVLTLTEITGCNVEFEVQWDNGDTTTETYSGTPFTMEANKVYYIRSTPMTFNFTAPAVGALPWYITFRLFGDGDGGPVTIAEVNYKAVFSGDWEQYLLFANGRGGCESVLMAGKATTGISATREVSRQARSIDFTLADGEIVSSFAEAQKEYSLNTGWIPRWYADHLRQLLLGDIWLIDKPNKRFIKMLCTSESVATKDDEMLHSLSIKLKSAWVDQAALV